MAIGRVDTFGTGVHKIETEAVCPAIKHLDTVIGNDIWYCSGLVAWHWWQGWS